ncbi:MAG: hypothetical protein IKU70_12165 [Clostridia bacterium]|nr:hypothetical protein [Clostridia bacterium]
MKKTFRLTALILALLMLVNISASATTTGITLNELDIATYTRMFQSASQAAQESETMEGPVLSAPCSADNQYCVLLSQLVELPTAQDRYDFMKDLYSEDDSDVTLEGVLLHYVYYGDEHNAAGKICECKVPAFAPEYEPGVLNVHDEECPWTFANLSVAEQYAVVMMLAAPQRESYIELLSAEQAAALEAYINAMESGDVCDGEGCGYALLQSMTGPQRYAQLVEWINTSTDSFGSMYNVFINHVFDKHPTATEVCLCDDFPVHYSTLPYGSFNHVNGVDVNWQPVDCPWHFDQLTEEEKVIAFGAMTTVQRAQMKDQMSQDDWDACTVALSGADYRALEAYLALQNSTDPEDQEKLENVNKTEQTVTSNGESEDEPSTDVAIKVPQGAFDVDYIMNAAASVLNDIQQAAMDALVGLRQLAVFDIRFEELAGGGKLQPNVPVTLTFEVDVSKVRGSKLFVHHLKDNGDGTYTAEELGWVNVDKSQNTQKVAVTCGSFSAIAFSENCDGGSENGGCGFKEFAALESGFEREKWLMNHLTDAEVNFATQFNAFVMCALENHGDVADINELICLCLGYMNTPADFHYGDLNHEVDAQDFNGDIVPCPWHFNQIPVEDQATVLNSLTTEEQKANYLATLNDDQKAALDAYMNASGEEEQWVTDLKDHMPGEDIDGWIAQYNPTEAMIARAMRATSLSKVILESDNLRADSELYYVRTGDLIAYYKYNAAENRGEIIEPSCQLVVGYVNVETGEISLVDGN